MERRRQIAGRLTDLLDDNLELDFDAVLRLCVADPDSAVRAIAAEGLGASDDRSLIEPLVGLLLEDEDAAVRAAACARCSVRNGAACVPAASSLPVGLT